MADSPPMTTSAPEAPVTKPKRTMSAEHKAKLAAGRAKWNASKQAAAVAKDPEAVTVHSASAPVAEAKTAASKATVAALAEVQRLTQELEAIKLRTGYLTPEEVAALPMEECYYEFSADKKTDRDEPIGERITTLDDPRWGELLKLRQMVVGHVIVEKYTRAKSGEILSRATPICVPARSPGQAKSMMEARAKNPTGQWY